MLHGYFVCFVKFGTFLEALCNIIMRSTWLQTVITFSTLNILVWFHLEVKAYSVSFATTGHTPETENRAKSYATSKSSCPVCCCSRQHVRVHINTSVLTCVQTPHFGSAFSELKQHVRVTLNTSVLPTPFSLQKLQFGSDLPASDQHVRVTLNTSVLAWLPETPNYVVSFCFLGCINNPNCFGDRHLAYFSLFC